MEPDSILSCGSCAVVQCAFGGRNQNSPKTWNPEIETSISLIETGFRKSSQKAWFLTRTIPEKTSRNTTIRVLVSQNCLETLMVKLNSSNPSSSESLSDYICAPKACSRTRRLWEPPSRGRCMARCCERGPARMAAAAAATGQEQGGEGGREGGGGGGDRGASARVTVRSLSTLVSGVKSDDDA